MDKSARARQNANAAVREWARTLYGLASRSDVSPDLPLNILTAILAYRIHLDREPRKPDPESVRNLSDLARGVEGIDRNLATDLFSGVAGRHRRVVDDAVAAVWKHCAGRGPGVFDSGSLGIAYEAFIELEDSAAGAQSRRVRGIYYTPPDVVDYIVDRTFGSSPDPGITVLDPACGSGAFLLGAYRRIAGSGSESSGKRSSAPERTIYGVDLDSRAVRLARLGLALEVGKRVARGMKSRIVAGSALDDIECGRSRPSAIDREFGHVLKQGGFDLVIGNPPYVKNKDLEKGRKELWSRVYRCARGQYDLLVLFVEKAIHILKPDGRLGFLVSNKFMTASYGEALRRHILDRCHVEEIVDLSRMQMFRGTAIYPAILILRKARSPGRVSGNVLLRNAVQTLDKVPRAVSVPQSFFAQRAGQVLTTALSRPSARVLARVEKNAVPLGDVARVGCGLADAGMARMFLDRPTDAPEGEGGTVLPFVRVENIAPYHVSWKDRWISLDARKYSQRRLEDFRSPKVVIPGIRRFLQAAYDSRGFALGRVYYVVESSLDYRILLALLNSRLLDLYYRTIYGAVRMAGGFLRFNGPYLKALPIARVDGNTRLLKRIAVQVDKRVELGKASRATKDTVSGTQRLERRIDELVLDLYGLSGPQREFVLRSARE